MGISGRSPDSGMEIFGYDKFNRLTNYNSGAIEATYTYDADNLRASKTVDREKTTFVWNGSNLASETTDSAVNTYTYDATGVYIANQNGTVTSYLKDMHGNIAAKADSSGAKLEESYMNYDAYGNQWQGNTPDPFGYCGEYYDTESGLIYLRNRYYESETGRFITEDPAKDGTNWYSYCAGNPVVLVDPSGKIKETDKIYGENSTVYKSLVYLVDAWTLFPENRSDIEELANEVRYLANADGAQNIDSILKGLRKVGQLPENLNYVEQVLIAGYPIDAAIMNSARNKADEATWNIFGEEGMVTANQMLLNTHIGMQPLPQK
ncbi:MAG: RHS repeat-associated core domain-containing protein [Lachnospiraceae bacterium]|nr:RHS repeat-associated core domain-containing protein [Lachnospiraceae bacterium]